MINILRLKGVLAKGLAIGATWAYFGNKNLRIFCEENLESFKRKIQYEIQ